MILKWKLNDDDEFVGMPSVNREDELPELVRIRRRRPREIDIRVFPADVFNNEGILSLECYIYSTIL